MIEQQIEQSFIAKLTGLKYEYRPDITDRATLEQNFRAKFDALNPLAKKFRRVEKTAIFFGRQHISTCFDGHPNKALYARFLNVRSHGKYSVFESASITPDDKKMLGEILDAFLAGYPFQFSAASLTTKPASLPATAKTP